MLSCNIEQEINKKKDELSSVIKERCLGKDYFQGHSLPPEQFIDVIIKDYLETIIICSQTGSMSVFTEKLGWFKDMYSSRKGEVPLEWMLDMFGEVKKALKGSCASAYKELSRVLEEMEDMMQRLFKESD